MRCKFIPVLFIGIFILTGFPSGISASSTGTVPCMLTSWSGKGTMVDESSLGNAAADAVRFASGADIAIISGGDIPNNAMRAGKFSQQDIYDAFSKDREIAVCSISVSDLTELLEVCVSRITLDGEGMLDIEASAFEGFPQVSGITFIFDAMAEPGDRIMLISRENGELLEPSDKMISLASSVKLLDGGYGTEAVEYTELDIKYTDAMTAFLENGVAVDYTKVDRIQMAGDKSDTLISKIPRTVILILILIPGLLGFFHNKRRRGIGDYKWDERIYNRNDKPLI